MPTNSTRYRAQPGDFGAEFICLPLSVASITANVTNTYGIGGFNDRDDSDLTRAHKAYVDEITCGQFTLVADADGTVLLNVFKWDASADAAVQLVTSFDLETQTAKECDRVPLGASLTEAQRTMETGDYLYATIVNNSAAINTQPVGLVVTTLLKLLK